MVLYTLLMVVPYMSEGSASDVIYIVKVQPGALAKLSIKHKQNFKTKLPVSNKRLIQLNVWL